MTYGGTVNDWSNLAWAILQGHTDPAERKYIEETLTRNHGNKDFWIIHQKFGYHIVNCQIAGSYKTKDYHFEETTDPETKPESKRRWYRIEL